MEKHTQLILRITKLDLFNFLKSQFPNLFGNKSFPDIESVGADPKDTSKLIIIFKEE